MGAALDVLVHHHLFAALCEEMGAALLRSAFSANIKERRDCSCALFDGSGAMIAQAAHLPVHLGSTPLSVQAALDLAPFQDGDTVVLNDPYFGGTHLPDITLVTPVFLGADEPRFFVANRAHHADVGGTHPGSMGPSRDVHGEGIRIPPVRLVRGTGVGEPELDGEVLRLLLANMRQPEERRGDLLAQWSANRVGARRLERLAEAANGAGGHAALAEQGRALVAWTARLAASFKADLGRALRRRGPVTFRDTLETGGSEHAVVCTLRSEGRGLCFDFTETADAVPGPANAPRAVTLSAVFYCLRLFLPPDTPTNDGVMDGVEVRTRPGSLVDAAYPAAVAAGNVETSQRLCDVVLGALGVLLPDRVPAASAGTMSNLTFGGPGFSHYETHGGGAGGGPDGPGASGVQTHMTNTLNTPVEVLETSMPVRVQRYGLRAGSGGAGKARGGDGLVRRLRFLAGCHVGWVAQRGRHGPYGLAGGSRAAAGAARVFRGGGVRGRRLAGEASLEVQAGDEVEVRTPGGGGWGQKGS